AANRKPINLSCGRGQAPKNPISCIVDLNDMIARLDMPLTAQVLLERVENEIGGIRPLTREGKTVDREAFVTLVRELADDDGLMGGPGMSAAVIGRARITLSKGENDLSVEQAIDHLLDLLPNRAVRLGFLLDLAASPLGEKEGDVIRQALERITQQLSFLASLMPAAEGPEKVALVVEKLKRRLDNDSLPEDWRQGLSASLDELVQRATGGGKKVPKKGTSKYTVDGGKKDMSDPTGERQEIKAGELIFEEGEFGEVAYLVVSGEIEIFRSSGNRERVLATVGRGEIIGEMSLIDNRPRVASARALSDTQVSLISRQSLQQRLDRLEKNDRVLRRLIGVLVDRIRGQASSPE
ncbi:MAG: cyclic nucleotide-binding domain-containing protein, partial [Proteobacteria bacterium]|nr:cyclic nucleotide-binding domain-containing protein [Pseudomonadota bacterium]